MADQDIREARERVQALREQVRAEQNQRAVDSAEMAKDARLSALSAEERHLEEQLADLQSIQRPGEAPEGGVPDGTVNMTGEPLDPNDPPPEGGFIEVVDAFGNLVRMPLANVDETTQSAADPNTGQPVPSGPSTDPTTGQPVSPQTAPGAPSKES